ncbi:MAG: hypothetical protein QXZ59_06300, partial [Nitrososphaeria archaeon]
DIIGKNIPIVDVTLFFIPCKNSDEAHYICSILNSSITQFIVTSYAVIHVSTQILKYLGIKKFNPEDKLHLKLSELSKKAHELAKRYYEQNDLVAWEELKKVEEEIDKTVAELYGITENELDEIKKCLIILKEGEVQEEEEAEEEMLPKEEGIEVSLEPLLINENRSQEISVKLTNDFNSDIEDLNLKISLKDKTIMSEEVKKIERSGERNLKFSCPALKAGQYNLKIELTFSINGERRKVEEERMLFVKAISKKMPTAFGDLDKLFGD